jgi:hypothetical protein
MWAFDIEDVLELLFSAMCGYSTISGNDYWEWAFSLVICLLGYCGLDRSRA